MRCKNCGWENDSNALRCEKCNAPLNGSMGAGQGRYDGAGREKQDEHPLKRTVRECDAINPIHENGLKKCPNCGYLYNSDMPSCPNCGFSEGKSPVADEHKSERRDAGDMIVCPKCHETVPSKFNFCANCGSPIGKHTINPWSQPQGSENECSLLPIAWENEGREMQPQKYSGDVIILNRDNTDPTNNSITSKEQAVLSYENGGWYIEDKSQMQTTYLHVGKKMPLENGDIIILGNRRFIFKG